MSRLEHAARLLDVHRPREAIAQLQQELRTHPESAEAFRMLAMAHLSLLEPDRALRAAEQALRLAPDDPWVLFAHSCALGGKGRTAKALQEIEDVLGREEQAVFHTWRGVLLSEQGRKRSALAAFERALAIDPTEAWSLDQRILVLRELGRQAEAGRSAHESLSLHPESHEFHEHVGRFELEAGRPRAADEHFREALRLCPTSVEAKLGLVDALRARNAAYRGLHAFARWSRRQGARLWTPRLKWSLAAAAALATACYFGSGAAPWSTWLFLAIVAVGGVACVWALAYLAIALVLPLFLFGAWLDPFGRHALNQTLGVRIAVPLAREAARPRPNLRWLPYLFAPLCAALLVLLAPLGFALACRPGLARRVLLALAVPFPIVVSSAYLALDTGAHSLTRWYASPHCWAAAAVSFVLSGSGWLVQRSQTRASRAVRG